MAWNGITNKYDHIHHSFISPESHVFLDQGSTAPSHHFVGDFFMQGFFFFFSCMDSRVSYWRGETAFENSQQDSICVIVLSEAPDQGPLGGRKSHITDDASQWIKAGIWFFSGSALRILPRKWQVEKIILERY